MNNDNDDNNNDNYRHPYRPHELGAPDAAAQGVEIQKEFLTEDEQRDKSSLASLSDDNGNPSSNNNHNNEVSPSSSTPPHPGRLGMSSFASHESETTTNGNPEGNLARQGPDNLQSALGPANSNLKSARRGNREGSRQEPPNEGSQVEETTTTWTNQTPSTRVYERIVLQGSQIKLVCPHRIYINNYDYNSNHGNAVNSDRIPAVPIKSRQLLKPNNSRARSEHPSVSSDSRPILGSSWVDENAKLNLQKENLDSSQSYKKNNRQEENEEQNQQEQANNLGSRIQLEQEGLMSEPVRWFRNHVPMVESGTSRSSIIISREITTTRTSIDKMGGVLAGKDGSVEVPWIEQQQRETRSPITETQSNKEEHESLPGTSSLEMGGPYSADLSLHSIEETFDSGLKVGNLLDGGHQPKTTDYGLPKYSRSPVGNKWYHVNQFGELYLGSAKPELAGKYTCLSDGQASEILLDVLMGPDGELDRDQTPQGTGHGLISKPIELHHEDNENVATDMSSFMAPAPGHETSVNLDIEDPSSIHFIQLDTLEPDFLSRQSGFLYTKNRFNCPIGNLVTRKKQQRYHKVGKSTSSTSKLRLDSILARKIAVRICTKLISSMAAIITKTTSNDSSTKSHLESCIGMGFLVLSQTRVSGEFLQLGWFRELEAIEFEPSGRASDKRRHGNLKLINMNQLYETRTIASSSYFSPPSSFASFSSYSDDERETKTSNFIPTSTSRKETKQIDTGVISSVGHQDNDNYTDTDTNTPQAPPVPTSFVWNELGLAKSLEFDGWRKLHNPGLYTCGLRFQLKPWLLSELRSKLQQDIPPSQANTNYRTSKMDTNRNNNNKSYNYIATDAHSQQLQLGHNQRGQLISSQSFDLDSEQRTKNPIRKWIQDVLELLCLSLAQQQHQSTNSASETKEEGECSYSSSSIKVDVDSFVQKMDSNPLVVMVQTFSLQVNERPGK